MGVVRGGMAPQARPRGRARRSAGRARRAAHRAPLRPSPRRALARAPRGSRGGGLGRGAAARPRLHHRRPRLAPLRDAGARGAACARLGRCYVVLGNHDFADSRDPFSQRVDPEAIAALEGVTLLGDDARRGRAARAARPDRRRRPADVRGPKLPLRTRSRTSRRTCGSSSATSRESSSASRASSTSCSPGTCTPARSSSRIRAGGSASRTCALATSRASTTTARRSCTSRPASARRSCPFRLFARPEVTELVVRSA